MQRQLEKPKGQNQRKPKKSDSEDDSAAQLFAVLESTSSSEQVWTKTSIGSKPTQQSRNHEANNLEVQTTPDWNKTQVINTQTVNLITQSKNKTELGMWSPMYYGPTQHPSMPSVYMPQIQYPQPQPFLHSPIIHQPIWPQQQQFQPIFQQPSVYNTATITPTIVSPAQNTMGTQTTPEVPTQT